MTMARAVAVAALAALLLAGCLGGSGDGGGQPGPTPTPTASQSTSDTGTPAPPPEPVQTLDLLLSFGFVDCDGFSVQVERPLADVQALLPDGFTAAPPPGAPSGVGYGAVVVDLLRCGNLTTPSVSVPSTYVGLETTYVQRPTGRVPQAPDAPVQEYLFRMLAGQDVLAALWPAAGYDTYSGPANVTLLMDAPARSGFGSVLPDYFLTASGGQADPLGGGRTQPFARYTLLDDGSILLWTGAYDLPAVAAGPGSAEVADDDPFAGFATPPTPGIPGTPIQSRPTLAGIARHVDGGSVTGQDLRRLFP